MLLFAIAFCVASSASAEPRKQALYIEALGHGGVWGFGYEHGLGKRLGLGGVASFAMLGHQRMYTLTPYLIAFPLRHGSHALFADLGAQLVRLTTPSPVPEWKGMSENGIGAELSAGYEYRNHILLRIYGQLVAGKGGVSPWIGAAIGWEF